MAIPMFLGRDLGQLVVAYADFIYTVAHEKVTDTEINGTKTEILEFQVSFEMSLIHYPFRKH